MLPTPVAPALLVNVLPINVSTWLEFYDRIPAELRQVSVLRWSVEANPKQYHEATGEEAPSPYFNRVEYQLDREWILARVAEELLPSRLTKDNVNTLESAMHRASKYDSSANFMEAVALLTPIWAVARS